MMDATSDATPSPGAPPRRLPSLPPDAAKRLAGVVGYPLFFLVCLALFAYLSFPYDRLKLYLIQQVEAQRGVSLEIQELGPWWLSGIHVSGARLSMASDTPEDDPLVVQVDELWASISLWSLLFGNLDLDFEAELGNGSLEGSYAREDELDRLQLTLMDVDVGRLGLLTAALGIPVRGQLSGDIDLNLAEVTEDTSGHVALEASQLVIGDGEHKLKLPGMGDGLTLDPLEAGNLVVDAKVEKGEARFEQLTAKGPDLDLDVQGNIRLARDIARSRVNLTIVALITDHYKQKSDKTKVLFELMNMNPALKRAKTSDGAISYRITGVGSNIRAIPAGGSARRRP